jgi:hypothetical protein
MSNSMEPTAEMILKYKVLKQSTARILWNDAKKDASKHVDIKVFDKNLGPALDSLRDISEAALKAKKQGKKLDPKTVGAVKKRKETADKIIREYQALVQKKVTDPKLTPAQKEAWGDLKGKLIVTASAPGNLSRAALK